MDKLEHVLSRRVQYNWQEAWKLTIIQTIDCTHRTNPSHVQLFEKLLHKQKELCFLLCEANPNQPIHITLKRI